MNNLKIFENAEFGQIRTAEVDGEPWFVGKDVAEALGYAEPRSAVSKKVEEVDRGVAEMETPSGKQNMLSSTSPAIRTNLRQQARISKAL